MCLIYLIYLIYLIRLVYLIYLIYLPDMYSIDVVHSATCMLACHVLYVDRSPAGKRRTRCGTKWRQRMSVCADWTRGVSLKRCGPWQRRATGSTSSACTTGTPWRFVPRALREHVSVLCSSGSGSSRCSCRCSHSRSKIDYSGGSRRSGRRRSSSTSRIINIVAVAVAAAAAVVSAEHERRLCGTCAIIRRPEVPVVKPVQNKTNATSRKYLILVPP